MNKSTPTKKKPIKAHRGRIVYEQGGRPMPGRPRPFPGFPRRPRGMPGRPMPFVSGPPRGARRGPRVTPRPSIPKDFLKRLQTMQGNPATSRRGQMIAEGEATRAGNKGMAVTKKAIGENDFRKGGLTLSTVNNLKKT